MVDAEPEPMYVEKMRVPPPPHPHGGVFLHNAGCDFYRIVIV